jgi:hypothetical protein
LTYYYYPSGTTQLSVGFVSSSDAGATWTAAQSVQTGMAPNWAANTSQGRMVGDYISTSFAGSTATTVFAVGKPSTTSAAFDEAMYAPSTPLTVATAAAATHPALTTGVQGSGTGVGTGEAHHELRDD